jgi:hypothetical protein
MSNTQEGVVDQKPEEVVVDNSTTPPEPDKTTNTTVAEKEEKEEKECDSISVTIKEPTDEPVNRTRRAIYIFLISIFGLTASTSLVAFGYESRISESFVLRLVDLVELVALIYVTASVMDKSKILSKIGDAVMARRGTTRRD